jgi:hypothetical protein
MAKRPRAAPPVQQPPGAPQWAPFGPTGPMFQIGAPLFQIQAPPTVARAITKSEMKESEIILDDGITIKITPTVQNVVQIIGQTGAAGEPVYTMQLSWSLKVIVPPQAPPKTSRKTSPKVRSS